MLFNHTAQEKKNLGGEEPSECVLFNNTCLFYRFCKLRLNAKIPRDGSASCVDAEGRRSVQALHAYFGRGGGGGGYVYFFLGHTAELWDESPLP